MSNNNQRRAGRALAQRRPAPARVQARRRAPGPSTSWLRIDWAKASAVVAVVAAIAGLLLTGISTFYGALVAREQLGQAREDARIRAEDQASKVTFWVEDRDLKNGHLLHVMNRSPDAITRVHVLIIAHLWLLPEGATRDTHST
ncbi:hypothetical protein AB0N62_29120 [Streptomyces sp. NPDC093982]|uniref:hypothetical protein n=1 Tax=Streptomyces sp. NPDC093982 TaxID=3155077 RepID=UPI003419689A